MKLFVHLTRLKTVWQPMQIRAIHLRRLPLSALVFGKVTPDEPLVLVSQMPEHGVIFSDGIEKDFIEFNSGTQAVIELAERKGRLVV